MLCVMAVAAVGYILGRITIKGVNLGTGGVFIIALVFGVFLYTPLCNALAPTVSVGETAVAYEQMLDKFLSVLENLGLVLFVTSVGFIAGPKFFSNLKKNFTSYILLGLIIIVAGALATVGCIYVGRLFKPEDMGNAEFTAMLVGILSGALTSTPAFSAAKDTVDPEFMNAVSVGHAIAYLFGVIGVVLFVQLIPKFLKADMAEERKKITAVAAADEKKYTGKLLHMDEFGFMPFALAAVIGVLLGSIKIGNFSLTTTGGCLLTALIFGHFSRIGKISIMPEASTLKVFREFGLMLFLIGAGVSGGAEFVAYFEAVYFLYGVVITIIPMLIGFLFAKYVLKLPLLNNLGSITGGMTSTPALGTLIGVSKTEDVASAYAATYPFALIAVVIASQLIIILFS
ncbi:MAG: permease [Clostridia bacterium]|nr:permease [Clostridia bacterium]